MTGKLILALAISSLAVFAPFSYYMLAQSRDFAMAAFVAKAQTIIQLIDSQIADVADLQDRERLWNSVQKTQWLNPDVLWIDVYEAMNGDIRVVMTTRGMGTGRMADEMGRTALADNRILHRREMDENGKFLRIASPIHIGRERPGIIEMGLTLETVNAQVRSATNSFFLGFAVMLALFCVVLFVALRLVVIRPLLRLVDRIRHVSGDGAFRLAHSGDNDEIGLLAATIDEMTTTIRQRDSALVQRASDLETANERLQQATKDLKQALFQTEQANRAKSEFLAAMSHDLRTPLNAIVGFSDVMRREHLGPLGGPRYKEYAGDIHESGQHMLALVTDLLDVSAIEAGSRSYEKTEIHLPKLAAVCMREIQGDADAKGLALMTDIAENMPPLFADPRAVRQILTNILSNAVKFTTSGRIALAIHRNVDFFEISVTDTGPGIKGALLPKVTEAFIQGTQDPHVTRSGAGLGLAIVKALTNAHGGDLSIESSDGAGTRVTVRLPVTPPSDAIGASAS